MSRVELRRAHLAGLLILPTLLLQIAAIFAPLVPDRWQVLAIQARMLEGPVLQLLLASLAVAAVVAGIGYRRAALCLAAVALAGLAWTAIDYRRMQAPVVVGGGTEANLSLLWFNMYAENPLPAERLAAALGDSGADVIVLTEADAAWPALAGPAGPEGLAARYPYRLACPGRCAMAVLSRLPFETAEIIDNGITAGDREILHVRLTPPGGAAPVSLLAVHMLKPWYLAFTGGEMERLRWVLRRYDEPTILVGDFNATPWSRRMRQIAGEEQLGFAGAPDGPVPGWPVPAWLVLAWPVPTWPASAGALGLPIDHVLVRGGITVASVAPWGGAALGSNHRGLLARLDVPGPVGAAAAPGTHRAAVAAPRMHRAAVAAPERPGPSAARPEASAFSGLTAPVGRRENAPDQGVGPRDPSWSDGKAL